MENLLDHREHYFSREMYEVNDRPKYCTAPYKKKNTIFYRIMVRLYINVNFSFMAYENKISKINVEMFTRNHNLCIITCWC